MFQEVAHPLTTASRGVRPADPRGRERAPHPVDGVVVEFAELLRRAAPVADVRLVPGFEVPLLDLRPPVLLDAVFRPLVGKLAPLRIILRRIRPARVNLV